MLFIVAFQKSFGVDFYSLEEGGGGMKIGSPGENSKKIQEWSMRDNYGDLWHAKFPQIS